jgi:hypothetical protein
LAQGLRGRVDWMYMTRDEDAATQPFITGPDAFNGSGIDFDYESGYRLMLGWGTPHFEIEGQFTMLDEWTDSSFATLNEELVFDDSVANPFIVGGTPGNSFGAVTALMAAAMDDFTATMDDETLEGEFLIPGATAAYLYETQYYDLEVNLTTSRCNWYRFGVGYRHINVEEQTAFGVAGLFDALDVDDGATVGAIGNDPNDGLSDAALTDAGFTRIAGGADGFDNFASAAGPDILGVILGSNAQNVLNGIQGTFDGAVCDSPYFLVDLFWRVGVFHNQSTARVSETLIGTVNDGSVYTRILQDDENDIAFATSGGFRVAVKLTDHVRLHTGYEVVYIEGLALAPDQIFQVTPAGNLFEIDTNGDLVIHGGRLGIEVVW